MGQRGLLFRAHDHQVVERVVPTPPADPHALQPGAYAGLLPEADPEHLLLAAVPLSEAAGRQILLVYNTGGSGPPNAIATRLTTSTDKDQLEVQVSGDALAFYAQPGADLTVEEWQQLDNAIYAELADPGNDVQSLVEGLKAGHFNYNVGHQGEEGEDVNKDDAGQDLQDALREP